jgi:branched-chain amino acid aminotransferase
MESELFVDRFVPTLQEGLEGHYELLVYVDGRFVTGEDAKISIWDHALLYGDGIFEGIRAYDGNVFKLDEHIDRLFNSAKALALTVPLTKHQMKTVVLETLKRNKLTDAHIRTIVTRGAGKPGLDPKRSVRPSVVVSAYPFPPMLGARPVRLVTASVRRKSPHAVDSKIKSLNYLDNILAKIQASVAGADDAIMLDTNGCVAEGTGENVFVVKDDAIHTPSTTACLAGITRATVMDLAAGLGYSVREQSLTLGDLYIADEIFLTGTGAEIVPVGQVDGREIGAESPGPVTVRINDAYQAYVREEGLTPIYG